MNVKKQDLKERTKRFALKVIKLVETLPRGRTADTLGRQLLNAGTSVGTNYRAACRARSTADFISKMGIVEEESDETIYWVELLIHSALVRKEDVIDLLDEGNQLLAINVSSIRTARRNKK
jgi:four helix bundle protein